MFVPTYLNGPSTAVLNNTWMEICSGSTFYQLEDLPGGTGYEICENTLWEEHVNVLETASCTETITYGGVIPISYINACNAQAQTIRLPRNGTGTARPMDDPSGPVNTNVYAGLLLSEDTTITTTGPAAIAMNLSPGTTNLVGAPAGIPASWGTVTPAFNDLICQTLLGLKGGWSNSNNWPVLSPNSFYLWDTTTNGLEAGGGTGVRDSGTNISFTGSAYNGTTPVTRTVYHKNSLTDTNWVAMFSITMPATVTTVTFIDDGGSASGFYKVQ